MWRKNWSPREQRTCRAANDLCLWQASLPVFARRRLGKTSGAHTAVQSPSLEPEPHSCACERATVCQQHPAAKGRERESAQLTSQHSQSIKPGAQPGDRAQLEQSNVGGCLAKHQLCTTAYVTFSYRSSWPFARSPKTIPCNRARWQAEPHDGEASAHLGARCSLQHSFNALRPTRLADERYVTSLTRSAIHPSMKLAVVSADDHCTPTVPLWFCQPSAQAPDKAARARIELCVLG